MTKIIQFQDYLLADEALDIAKNMLRDNQDDLALENQQLLSEVLGLEGNLESQALISASLKGQVKELQVENDILLDALESNDIEELPVMLTDVVGAAAKPDVASQSHYWEQEYSVLKDKIRYMEEMLAQKDKALNQAGQQNEQLLNELLAK